MVIGSAQEEYLNMMSCDPSTPPLHLLPLGATACHPRSPQPSARRAPPQHCASLDQVTRPYLGNESVM